MQSTRASWYAADDAASELYVPEGQIVQSAIASWYAADEAASALYFPEGQIVHVPVPADSA